MIYFVDAKTKKYIEYGDEPSPHQTYLPKDLNDIAREIIAENWCRLYAVGNDGQRSDIYKIDNVEDIACYLIMALYDVTSLHYARYNSIARGYTSKKRLGVIETYKGRYGVGYKWFTHCPRSNSYRLVTYLVF